MSYGYDRFLFLFINASVGMTGLFFQIIPLSFKTACNSLSVIFSRSDLS